MYKNKLLLGLTEKKDIPKKKLPGFIQKTTKQYNKGQRMDTKNCQKKKKEKIKRYQRDRYQQLLQYKKETLQNK